MTENLRLEFDGNTTYDSSTTDLASGATITPSATQARTSTPTQAEIDDWKVSPDSPTEDEINRWLSRGTHNADGSATTESDTGTGDLTRENQKFGTYFNWYTATAGTNATTSSWYNAPYSICPAGWRLQYGSSIGSWKYLVIDSYAIIKNQGNQLEVDDGNPNAVKEIMQPPISAPFSGRVAWYSGQTIVQGDSSFYFAATNTDLRASRNFRFTSSLDVYPSGGLDKTNGMSIRCIAK